jgi:hypothetical protein
MAQNPNRRRVLVETKRPGNPGVRRYQQQPRETIVATAMIAAAALATLAALLLTSRPYDPMNSSIAPQTSVPSAPLLTDTSPKPSPSTTATPAAKPTPAETPEASGETTPPDDGEIKSQIERAFSSDPTLADADITVVVENGRVTLAGSVESIELKQKAQRLARSVKGVLAINDQLVVRQVTPQ